MKPTIHATKTLRLWSSTIFGIFTLLTVLSLTVALSGSSSAETKVPAGENKPGISAPLSAGRIVFASTRDGQSQKRTDIYTISSDGSNVVRLTTDAATDIWPDWSPDGSKIVFSSSRDHPDNSVEIYVMNSDGSNQHIIPTGQTNGSLPSWSPDGSKILFEAYPAGSAGPEIYVMNSNGSGVTRLTFTSDGCYPNAPSWSPNGSMIAFDMQDCQAGKGGSAWDGIEGGTHSIYVMAATGGSHHPITSGHADFEPDWSPDGTKIAFSRNDNQGHWELWKVSSGGGGETLVTSGDYILGASWSPDGQQIVYSDRLPVTLDRHLYVVNANGSNPHSISGAANGDAYPDWGHINSMVLVQGEDGLPVAGAQVYTNTNGSGYPSTYIGTTGSDGTLGLRNPQTNEYIIARTLVYTGTTSKGAHDGWAYHVWLTNIEQQLNGQQSAFMITDTTQPTQTVTISRDKALVGFNVVASIEYNATVNNISTISDGLSGSALPGGFHDPGASDYLLDVTDGQMYFENVTIYENKANWDDADYQFFASYPRADANRHADGRSALTGTCCHIHAQGSGHFGTDPWNQRASYSVLIHEFSHYAIGALDEYFYQVDGDNADCSLDAEADYQRRASIMAHQADSSEYCTQDNHNPLTAQGAVNGESVWQTLVRNWDDPSGRWTMVSPITRGSTDPGPTSYICDLCVQSAPVVVLDTTPSCAPIAVHVIDANGLPVAAAEITLRFEGLNTIDEGETDRFGNARIYGGETGQLQYVRASLQDPNNPGYRRSGYADITTCNALTIQLSTLNGQEANGRSSRPSELLPSYWITSTASFGQGQVYPIVHFAADPSEPPLLYVSQGGTNSQQVNLTYDPAGQNYSGNVAFDPNRSLDFKLEVGITGTQGLQIFPHNFSAAQYYTTSPERVTGGKPPFAPPVVPSNWDIFPPESPVNLSIDANSMPDGTGVMGGDVTLPAAPPNGLLAVGGPYSIQGENPISGSVHLSLEFQSELFCGLIAGSTKVYRYNGTGWDALTTSVNQEWQVADAAITQWGIYGVFAQPNPQVVFSDVPAGSTFHDYISWMTCHGIASGYADGTFRPNNNATRGQISKMVANAYRWHLDPPAAGYTFADARPGSTFFLYIEAAYREGVVSGYSCGGPGEPCDPQHRPYFRPNSNVTRGQLSKIISNASKWGDTPTGQTFEDVPSTNTFYQYIERMASRGIINGYACGSAGQPCVPPGNRPYFRPGSHASRGQLSKMIYLALQLR